MYVMMDENLFKLCMHGFIILITQTIQITSETQENMFEIKDKFDIPIWPAYTPTWQLEFKKLLLDGVINKPTRVSLKDIEEKSALFPINFPIETVCFKNLKREVSINVLEKYINSAYPVLSEHVLPLFIDFLLHKRKLGNEAERKLYATMTLIEFVDRLLLKRAVQFIGVEDNYLLLDGKRGSGISNLTLDDCISYDEIKLSAFLSVSSYSYFINDGNRYNQGVYQRLNVEEEGIVIGLIGTRLEKPKVMEYQEVIISKDQNHEGNGYGTLPFPTVPSVFLEFYSEVPLTYNEFLVEEQQQPNRFFKVEPEVVFDKRTYCKRLSLSFDTLLHEANCRAKEKNTLAFIHVVGIGLGVWKLTPQQHSLFLDTFASRIQFLGDSLHSVSDIVFAYFHNHTTSGGYKNDDLIPISGHPKGGIQIHFSQRQPHVKLTGEDQGKLLVVSYAWDGNALPGNGFWSGLLTGSGDPAQACSSQIAEIHNPHINPQVCAANLRITTNNGLELFSTYRENLARKR